MEAIRNIKALPPETSTVRVGAVFQSIERRARHCGRGQMLMELDRIESAVLGPTGAVSADAGHEAMAHALSVLTNLNESIDADGKPTLIEGN